jgi:CCR4-NOT transcriptional regulation complex NOT5 subunit
MPTIYQTQVSSALEAELAAKNKIIEDQKVEIETLTKQRDQIKTKWEDLMDSVNQNGWEFIDEI